MNNQNTDLLIDEIKRLANKKGVSLTQLAKELDINYMSLKSNIRKNRPHAEIYYKLARYFNVTMEHLYEFPPNRDSK